MSRDESVMNDASVKRLAALGVAESTEEKPLVEIEGTDTNDIPFKDWVKPKTHQYHNGRRVIECDMCGIRVDHAYHHKTKVLCQACHVQEHGQQVRGITA